MNLLLLPGLLCDRAVWAPVLPRLERSAECRVPDYADETSLSAMAQRVLRDAPPTFALAGHSMGGRVALEIVRRAPERVTHLALLDTGFRARPAGAAGEDERARRLALLALAQEQGMRAMARAWVQPMVYPARLADAALIDAVLGMFERRTPAQFAGQIEALLARPEATELLRTIACPTLVLCGRADGWSTPAQHEEVAALIPGSRLAIVEDGGHMAPMERPDAVGAAMRTWLRTPASIEACDV
ncbi:MAG: alpha/beta fold hydrolase [Betaproteobacteria bacterium]